MKKTLLTLSALSLSLMLSGCTSASDMTTATQQPSSTASTTASPNVTTVLPGAGSGVDGGTMDNGGTGTMDNSGIGSMDGSGGMNGENGANGGQPSSTVIPESTGVTSMDKAKRVIEQIEEELERLSEVDDAEVVIAGNKAAVGLEFDDQYKTGLDDRLRKIVKERIDGVISGISTVAITTDEGVMDAIESLGERLETMSDMTALQSDLDAIIKKINGMNA